MVVMNMNNLENMNIFGGFAIERYTTKQTGQRFYFTVPHHGVFNKSRWGV